MTNAQLGSLIVKELSTIYDIREARAIKRYLFSFLSGKSLVDWLSSSNEEADPEFQKKILSVLPQLLQHIPVQYIIGKVWFCDLELNVTSDVLIPRPETEQLVNLIIDDLSNQHHLSILDIGTGSGAIAVSLAFKLRNAKVSALDISEKAIQVAKANALKHQLVIDFVQYNILQNEPVDFFNGMIFNVIVSNPPYIKASEAVLMDKNVLNHEPHQALFVSDDDPLIFYREILIFSKLHLAENGYLYLEINETEGDNLRELIYDMGFKKCQVISDLNDKPRFIKAWN